MLRAALADASAAWAPALAPALQQLQRGIATSAAAAAASSEPPHSHVFDEYEGIVGPYTPMTKRLWLQRYRWTEEKLRESQPRDPAATLGKPPHRTRIQYPFSTNPVVKEHYRNPWGDARIGRILEDLDSLAGFVAFDHCDDGDPSTRPPLLVTASVEAIQLRGSRITLAEDMEMSGRVVYTGTSSLDIRMELEQGGQQQLTALFTFVARDALSGQPFCINAVQPQTPQDQECFEERRRISQALKAARKAAGGRKFAAVSPEGERWAQELLAAAKMKRDLPALADPSLLLMDDTSLQNTFTCQPEQRNMHGRVFGGFLMRRAFELAHSTAYLFAGCRPRTLEVDRITFQRPVNVGDLIRFRSWVLRAWPSELHPGKGVVHVQVEASVTQPEQQHSVVTNTFGFRFLHDLRRDAAGQPIPPKQVLPSTEQQALEVAQRFFAAAP